MGEPLGLVDDGAAEGEGLGAEVVGVVDGADVLGSIEGPVEGPYVGVGVGAATGKKVGEGNGKIVGASLGAVVLGAGEGP